MQHINEQKQETRKISAALRCWMFFSTPAGRIMEQSGTSPEEHVHTETHRSMLCSNNRLLKQTNIPWSLPLSSPPLSVPLPSFLIFTSVYLFPVFYLSSGLLCSSQEFYFTLFYRFFILSFNNVLVFPAPSSSPPPFTSRPSTLTHLRNEPAHKHTDITSSTAAAAGCVVLCEWPHPDLTSTSPPPPVWGQNRHRHGAWQIHVFVYLLQTGRRMGSGCFNLFQGISSWAKESKEFAIFSFKWIQKQKCCLLQLSGLVSGELQSNQMLSSVLIWDGTKQKQCLPLYLQETPLRFILNSWHPNAAKYIEKNEKQIIVE